MPGELLKFPVGVLRVKVAGFKPTSVGPLEDVLPYCPEWSLRATMEMVDLLQTNIRVSVVVRSAGISCCPHTHTHTLHRDLSIQALEPELTVLLYNTEGELAHLPLVRRGLAKLE